MAPKRAALRRTTKLNPGATSDPNQAPSTTTTTITNAQLQARIDQGVNAALAARDANRTGDDSHTSGTSVRRTERAADLGGVGLVLLATAPRRGRLFGAAEAGSSLGGCLFGLRSAAIEDVGVLG
nr:hypothetical protein [Tanacetum cinerariifolium]